MRNRASVFFKSLSDAHLLVAFCPSSSSVAAALLRIASSLKRSSISPLVRVPVFGMVPAQTLGGQLSVGWEISGPERLWPVFRSGEQQRAEAQAVRKFLRLERRQGAHRLFHGLPQLRLFSPPDRRCSTSDRRWRSGIPWRRRSSRRGWLCRPTL